ncbi:MAG: glycogen synthase, partial [Gaiella sp.]
ADAVVAVSPTYAAEIRRPEHGYGLDGLLRERGDALAGILNGIETDVWDPTADAALERPFDAATLGAKKGTTDALRADLGLARREVPLLVLVTRLTWQKGIDLLLPALPLLGGIPCQLALLGAGDSDLAHSLRSAADAAPDDIAFVEGYDDRLSHRLLGGGDILVMPSRYEACGLSQMQAMRYGTIPVVTDVGGLHDTVTDADRHPRTGTGFVAGAAEPLAVLDAIHRACRAWRVPNRRQAIQRRGMKRDWSWQQPAREYLRLYGALSEVS